MCVYSVIIRDLIVNMNNRILHPLFWHLYWAGLCQMCYVSLSVFIYVALSQKIKSLMTYVVLLLCRRLCLKHWFSKSLKWSSVIKKQKQI